LGVGAIGLAGGVYLYVSGQAAHAPASPAQAKAERSFSLGVAGAF
jgi:hypothetical protein